MRRTALRPLNPERAKRKATSYRDYLASPEWARVRERAIARAGGRCELCGMRPGPRNGVSLHVHHATYARFGREHLDDLAVLCMRPDGTGCHATAHQDDSYKRQRRAVTR